MHVAPEIFDEVRERYSTRRLALFLGAGVSASCGLPDWKTLSELVVDEAIWVDPDLGQPGHVSAPTGHYERLYLKKLGALDALRLVRARKGSDFPSLVARALYKKDSVESDTVAALTALRSCQRICTFNYDDILQTGLSRRGFAFTIVRPGDPFSLLDESTYIFHPHGYLPRYPSPPSDASVDVVLTEDDYHRLYAEPYSWANVMQISLLLNYAVLFVGFSLTDPNTRRLLDVVKAMGSKHKHFALLLDPTLEIRKAEAYSWFPSAPTALKVAENALTSRGVNPIWVDDYAEIPVALRRVAQSDLSI